MNDNDQRDGDSDRPVPGSSSADPAEGDQSVPAARASGAGPANPARRGMVAGSGLAMLGLFGPRQSGAQGWENVDDWTEVEKQNVRVVEQFCDAWSTRDLSQVTATMAGNSIYRMSETTPPVHGHEGLAEQMQGWIDSSHTIVFEILQTVAKGPIVMNHRIDYWMSETRPVTWEGVGVFFLQDGKIVEWSDYNIRIDRG